MTHVLPLLDVPAADSDEAGFGALETKRGRLPLKAMDVRAGVSGLLAHTSVRQTFRNAFDQPLEATYIFPLPDRAAVTRFRMTVADRVIEGELKERGQARQEYDEAIEKGHRAAIAEEERSGVFTMRVGNIPPHEEATVELELVGPLEMTDDEATFRFPLVVAPRYTPGVPLDGADVGDGVAADTGEVPDASRVTPPVLLPGFPNPVRLSLEVELDPAGLQAGLSAVRSSLHSVVVNEQGPPWTVRLQPGERLNRDFILRFPVAAPEVQTTLQCSPAEQDKPGVFALTLTPPTMKTVNPRPREVVFVLDRSGSMSGWKMVAARRALGRMIDTLLDQDRFTVIAFDDQREFPPEANKTLVAGVNRNRWRVLEWLGKIDARGGTEMGPALKAALECFSSPRDTAETTDRAPGRASRRKPDVSQADTDAVDRVLVVVTDGQVTGEDSLLRTLKKSAPGAMPRVFTLGIDRAVNAGFLRRLANLGGGACDLVESEDRLDEALDGVHRRIGRPVLTDVKLELLDFDGVAESLAPSRIAGLYAGRPLMIFGRHLSERPNVRLRVSALDADGKPWSEELAARPGPADVLLNLWGRARVRELEDRYAAEGGYNEKLAEQIVKTSLESHVLSRFTAYVAVDKSEVVNPGGKQHKVLQPVEAPSGWDAARAIGAARSAPTAFASFLAAPQGRMRMTKRKASFDRSPPPPCYESVDSCLQEFAADEDALAFDEAPCDASDSTQVSFGEPFPFVRIVSKLLNALTGRRKKRLNLTILHDASDELRQTVETMRSAAAPPSRDEFAQLVESLKTLAATLSEGGHPASTTALELADEGRQILEAWDATGDVGAVRDRLYAVLGAVVQELEKLQNAAPPKRDAFWKSPGGAKT